MKTTYNKLVRDRIPEIIKQSGKKVNYRTLNDMEYKQALKDKLVEEVNEFLAAQTKEEIHEEMADIMMVIQHIVRVFELPMHHLLSVLTVKNVNKGGFVQRYFLESVEDEGDKSILD